MSGDDKAVGVKEVPLMRASMFVCCCFTLQKYHFPMDSPQNTFQFFAAKTSSNVGDTTLILVCFVYPMSDFRFLMIQPLLS